MNKFTITLVEVPKKGASPKKSRLSAPRRIRRSKRGNETTKFANPRPTAKFENLLKKICTATFFYRIFARLYVSQNGIAGEKGSDLIEESMERLFKFVNERNGSFPHKLLSDRTVGEVKDFYRFLSYIMPVPLAMSTFLALYKIVASEDFLLFRRNFTLLVEDELRKEGLTHVHFL